MEYLQQIYLSGLNAVCHEGGAFQLQQGHSWTIHEHTHTQNKFYFFTGGSCRLTINGNEYTTQKGDWFLIPAGTRHSYTHLPHCSFRKYWFHFDLHPNNSLPRLLQLPYRVQVTDGKAEALFRKLARTNNSDKLADKLHAKASLMSLLAMYVELAHGLDLPVQALQPQPVDAVLDHIHAHLSEPLHNRDLASVCHMHPNHFIRYFSKNTGMTPAAYVMQEKMAAAKLMLEQTDLPVSAIMEQVGIQEPSHFAKLFRRYYSMSPTQYRKQLL